MEPIESELWGIVKEIRGYIARGLKRDAILERLGDPAGVGAQLLDRLTARKDAGESFLGRASVDVMVRVEDEKPEPKKRSRRRG